MTEEKVSCWIPVLGLGTEELGSQTVYIVAWYIGSAGARFQVIEKGRQSGEELLAAAAMNVSRPVSRGMLKRKRKKLAARYNT